MCGYQHSNNFAVHLNFIQKYRRALISRFPYAVFYEYLTEKIYIYSVFHTSLNPDKWRKRLA